MNIVNAKPYEILIEAHSFACLNFISQLSDRIGPEAPVKIRERGERGR
jgi:hypothetical protein